MRLSATASALAAVVPVVALVGSESGVPAAARAQAVVPDWSGIRLMRSAIDRYIAQSPQVLEGA
jgi:hypothetical protein